MLDFVTRDEELQASRVQLERHVSPIALKGALLGDEPEYPHIRVCRDWGILKRIGKLRHEQYIQRQQKKYHSIVQEPDCFLEEADFSSVNVYAFDGLGLTSADI